LAAAVSARRNTVRVRIVVADACQAGFYDLQHQHDVPRLAGQLSDSLARMRERDLTSDRPGRSFDHAPLGGGRRGATPRHAMGSQPRAHRHEVAAFVKTIAEQLERARQAGEFDRLVIMAPPTVLGLLRKALPSLLLKSIAAEVDKDLVREPAQVVQSHVPQDAFHTGLR
jgi:protein required for attachment to host cells